MKYPKRLSAALAAFCLLAASSAQAWWNGDWGQRAKLTLNAGAAGLAAPAAQVPVLVRLHSGNFDFAKAKPDGSDLRFVAADDKTPLRHHLEKWDPEADIGLAWVNLPALAPGADAAIWLYYGNAKAAKAEDVKGTYDPAQVVVLHFSEAEGMARDATGYANNPAEAPPARNPASIIGNGAQFNGGEGLTIPISPSLKFTPAGGLTFSAWVKVDAAGKGTLVAVGDKDKRVELALEGAALVGTIEAGKTKARASGGALAPGTWHHVALTAGRELLVYLDGAVVAKAAGELPEFTGFAQVGRGYAGEMDELAIATAARSADYLLAAAKGQGPDALLVAFGEGEETGGGSSYIGILLAAVTVDGWVVIGILGVMLVIGAWVTVSKTMLVNRNERANGAFLRAYREGAGDASALLAIDDGRLRESSLFRVYRAGVEEVQGRFGASVGAAATRLLSDKAIESIRATLDAAQVRENQRLNRSMVLLTIAISGGPFLGLLGTVVGVMITFAAIAATGDVNVAAIAPGIAGALVATVAGLGVAIPALFAYNYIGSRIKNVSADMRVFADEFLARMAESYGG
jgi:biopolymer transport protein ExbB